MDAARDAGPRGSGLGIEIEVEPLRAGRTLVGGFLMGLANLVPGISGGTIILAIGLYDRFIRAVADVTSLRWSRSTLLFLTLLMTGAVLAVAAFSGLAVGFVRDQRWVAYSLFVGMTLGGVPLLVRLCRPWRPGVFFGLALGLGVMLAQALDLFSIRLPETLPFLVLGGALGASSMVLPGISGAYVLLLLGLYELVIGSMSPSAIRDDPSGSLRILLPVLVGAGLGVGLLSNLLRWLLARYSAPVHGALLGLLLGSVLGLYPFRNPTNPELADRATRKSVALLVAGTPLETVRERHGLELPPAEAQRLMTTYAGKSPAELKRMGDATRSYRPALGRAAAALGLLALGLVFTRLIARNKSSAGAA